MATESGGSTKPVAVIIIGADALLAARPATPIQLWHACLAAGYDLAVPATWGDELIAAECLRAIGSHPEPVTVMCSCPLVARALGDGEADLSASLISLVAPPVATARYLRRVYGDRRVHVTFVGACPAAGDSAIDAWISPSELMERFAVNAIDLNRQPQLFESVLPPDRRRHLSLPGGLPAPERAASLPRPRQITELDDDDIMASIRRHLLSGARSLVDVAPRLGCACSGAVRGVVPSEARLAVALVEPPRSAGPVMVDPVGLALIRRVPPRLPPRPDVRPPDPRPTPGEEHRPGASRDAERPVATSRTHSRSPLSWNLRERALPQPPTSGRPSGTSAGRGASSATWSALHPPRSNGPAGAPPATTAPAQVGKGPSEADAETVAAVRALEAAAQSARRIGGAESVRPADAGPAAVTGSASAVGGSRDTDAPEDESAPSRQPRGTPPGGYWFVPAGAPRETDAEVERTAEPAGDLARGAESTPADSQEGESVAAELHALFSQKGPAPGVESTSDPSLADASVREGEVLTPSGADRTGPEGVEGAPGRNDSPAAADVSGEPSVPAQGSPPESSRTSAGEDGPTPPDRAWVITMTIIVLLAGAMVARNVVQRRAGEGAVVTRTPAGPVQSVSAGVLHLPPEIVKDAAAPSASPEVSVTARAGRRATQGPPRRRQRAGGPAPRPTADSATASPQPPSVVAGAASVAQTELAQAEREAEIRAIREELARRAARLDSMGRVVSSLFGVPRVAPPRSVPPPPSR